MGVTLKQNADGSLGLQGSGQLDDGGFVHIDIEYNASSIDKTSFVANRNYRVKGITARPTVAGTDGSAVTATVKKAPSGTAITAGTALHSSTIDLKGTINTNQVATLSATSSDLSIAKGDAIGADFGGTLTAAAGVITVLLAPM